MQVDVEVEDVELVRPAAHLVQHGQMGGEIGLQRVRVEPDGLVAARAPACALVRASALANSVTSWPRSTSASVRWATIRLRAAVEAGRHRFVEGRDLGDPHRPSLALSGAGAAPPLSSRRRWRTELPPMMIASMIAAAAR